MAAPSADDLSSLFTAAGVDEDILEKIEPQFEGAIEAATKTFLRLTGRNPFIAGDNDSTVRLDPPGDTSASSTSAQRRGGEKVLELPIAFVSITAISTGCSANLPDGKLLVDWTDYNLYPENYDIKGLPIEWIEFRSPVYGGLKSVKIVGKPGSYSEWPADAKATVVNMAASTLVPMIMNMTFGGAESWEEGDVKEKYGTGFFETFREQILGTGNDYPASTMSTISSYRFRRVGL